MDTATASLVNKPLKETEGPLDDVSPVHGCHQLAAHMKIKQEKINRFTSLDVESGIHLRILLALLAACLKGSVCLSTTLCQTEIFQQLFDGNSF